MKKNRKKIIEELENMAPQLANAKAKAPDFSTNDVPEGYFDQLSNQIMNQLELEPSPISASTTQTIGRNRWQQLFGNFLRSPYALGFASVLVLLVMVFLVIPSFEKDTNLVQTDQELNNELSSEELYTYILENIEDFDSETILNLASDVPLDLMFPNEFEGEDVELEELMEELLEEVDFINPSDMM